MKKVIQFKTYMDNSERNVPRGIKPQQSSLRFANAESERVWREIKERNEKFREEQRELLKQVIDRAQEEGKEKFDWETFKTMYPLDPSMPVTPGTIEDYTIKYYFWTPGIKTMKDFAKARRKT